MRGSQVMFFITPQALRFDRRKHSTDVIDRACTKVFNGHMKGRTPSQQRPGFPDQVAMRSNQNIQTGW